MMQEKCYRSLQSRGELGGIGLFELLALVGVPLLLLPIFTLLDLNVLFIVAIEIALFALFRIARRLSPFEHGLMSWVHYQFIWPRRLSAFQLKEYDYLIRETASRQEGHASD